MARRLLRLNTTQNSAQRDSIHSSKCSNWSTLLVTFGLVFAAQAEAQFVQYTPEGDFHGPAEAREVVFDRAMRDAKWRFGRLLVDPWLGLRNVGYQDNLTDLDESGNASPERVADFTATIGAGLNAYLPIGSDFTWGVFALPEYVWWQDLSERSRLNGRYGTGLFGNMGRIGVEASAIRSEQAEILSVEIDEPFNRRTDRAELEMTVDLGKGFLAFARGSDSERRSLEESDAYDDLDRLDSNETVYSAGVSFLSTRGFNVGVGFEESETETVQTNRSNTGTAFVLDLQYDAPLVKVKADIAHRSIEPTAGSDFVEFEGNTGSLSLTSRAFGPVWLELFGRRNLSLSVQDDVSHIESESLGAGLRTSFGSRTGLRVFLEQGDSTYVEGSAETLERIDDMTSLGATLSVQFGRMSLGLSASRSEYDSNFSEHDRTITRVGTSLVLAVGKGGGTPWGG